jgi:hypothetical protein
MAARALAAIGSGLRLDDRPAASSGVATSVLSIAGAVDDSSRFRRGV